MRRSRKFLRAWISLVLALVPLALEGGLRVYERVARPPGIYTLRDRSLVPSAIPGLGVELNPTHADPRARVNEHGFRGAPFPREKPPGERRVFLVGDSVTYGFGLPEEATIAARLQTRFDEVFPEGQIRVVNAGVPSYNAAQILTLVERKLPLFKPDLIVALFNFTDFDCPALVSLPGLGGRALCDHSALARALVRLRAFGERRLRGAEASGCETRNARAVGQLAERAEREPGRWLFVLHPWLGDEPRFRGEHARLHRLLAPFPVPILDTGPVLRERFGRLDGLGVSATDNHPGPAAAEAIADAIFSRLRAMGFPAEDQTLPR